VFFLHQGTKYRELFPIAYAFYDKKYLGFALTFIGNVRVNFAANSEDVLVVGS
jgi:hypothetical protein